MRVGADLDIIHESTVFSLVDGLLDSSSAHGRRETIDLAESSSRLVLLLGSLEGSIQECGKLVNEDGVVLKEGLEVLLGGGERDFLPHEAEHDGVEIVDLLGLMCGES